MKHELFRHIPILLHLTHCHWFFILKTHTDVQKKMYFYAANLLYFLFQCAVANNTFVLFFKFLLFVQHLNFLYDPFVHFNIFIWRTFVYLRNFRIQGGGKRLPNYHLVGENCVLVGENLFGPTRFGRWKYLSAANYVVVICLSKWR